MATSLLSGDQMIHKTTVVLVTSKDYHNWLFFVKVAALKTGVWSYINPDLAKDELSKNDPPKKPLPREIQPAQLDANGTVQRDAAASIRDLDRDRLAIYSTEFSIYRDDLQEFNRIRKALAEITMHISGTIDKRHIPIIQDLTEPYDQLKALTKQLCPTDASRKREVAAEYNRVRLWKGRQNVDKWLEEWQNAYVLAKKLNLPEVHENRAQEDFVLAIKAIHPEFTGALEVHLSELELKNEAFPTVEDLQARFTNFHRKTGGPKMVDFGYSAHATLNGQSPPASGNDTKPHKPCLCGDNHRFRDCSYLFAWNRLKDWKPDAQKDKKVKDKLQKNWKLRATMEKIEKQRNSDTVTLPQGPIDIGSPSEMTPRTSFAAMYGSSFSTTRSKTTYSLENSWILDPGADIHVCNNDADFRTTKPAVPDEDVLIAGSSQIQIEAWGDVTIKVDTPTGPRAMDLHNVALVRSFFTNVVALSKAIQNNIHFDSGRNVLYDGSSGATVCTAKRVGGHWCLMHRLITPETYESSIDSHETFQTFASARPRPWKPSIDKRPIGNTHQHFHKVLGHPSKQAINHLPAKTRGIVLTDGERAPAMNECSVCTETKLHQTVSRSTDREFPAGKPFERIAIDIIELSYEAYNGHRYILHSYDTVSKYNRVLTLAHVDKATVVPAIKSLAAEIKREFGIDIIWLWTDDEQGYGRTGDHIKGWCKEEGIKLELRSLYTPEQNGAAERSGKTLIQRARAMQLEARLPAELAPEIFLCAAYLLNRTPNEQIGWRTPYEIVYGRLPPMEHLRVWGCKAYALNKKIPKGKKLDSRAFIGYLVGYDSTNIYRIWIPEKGEVIRTRDVIFHENDYRDANPQTLGLLVRDALEDIIQVIEQPIPAPEMVIDYKTGHYAMNLNLEGIDLQAPAQSIPPSSLTGPLPATPTKDKANQQLPTPDTSRRRLHESPSDNGDASSTSEGHSARGETPIQEAAAIRPSEEEEEEEEEEYIPNRHENNAPKKDEISATLSDEHVLPEGSRRTGKSAHAAFLGCPNLEDLASYYSAFATGLMKDLKSYLTRKLHRDQLPPPPKNWKEMLRHPCSAGFKLAAGKEVNHCIIIGVFLSVTKEEAGDAAVIPIIWIFTYKFDADGFLIKFKARICVRGDLQITYKDTFAATVAARTFRALMAIAAIFDLEIWQWDAVNAFLNAKLTEKTYCTPPQGFEHLGSILLLLRALYGLKQSPQLWYNKLRKTLLEIGLTEVPGVNCLFTDSKLIVFFYVDDIVAMCTKQDLSALREFENALLQRYQLRQMGELQWFLGIRVDRDRKERKLWLSQASFISKICKKFNIKTPADGHYPKTPLPDESIQASEQKYDAQRTYAYQQRIGSLAYLALIGRPDIAHDHALMSRFLTNPSQKHLEHANRMLKYLLGTMYHAIQLSAMDYSSSMWIEDESEPEFYGASDAAFGDDPATRKSSQGYLFKLFGGAIDWKATLQRSVTRSTTEAELLSLSTAAVELQWWNQFFRSIRFDPEVKPSLFCDNWQTVQLMRKDTPKLNTKLRHVDIHQHWLRQEVQEGRIDINWLPTNQMPADGLTKHLPRQKHEIFMRQLGLVDIRNRIFEKCEAKLTNDGSIY